MSTWGKMAKCTRCLWIASSSHAPSSSHRSSSTGFAPTLTRARLTLQCSLALMLVLVCRFLTEEDEAIRFDDCPERLLQWHKAGKRSLEAIRAQSREQRTLNLTREAKWIVTHALKKEDISNIDPRAWKVPM